MMRLVDLTRADWPAVHALMVARSFPHVPAEYTAAVPFFKTARVLGAWREGRLAVVFVRGEPQDGIAFLDVVCAAELTARWASRGLLDDLKQALFGQDNLRAVWVQVHSKAALRAALKAGFCAATPLNAPQPILVMTRLRAGFGKIYISTQEQTHGQFI